MPLSPPYAQAAGHERWKEQDGEEGEMGCMGGGGRCVCRGVVKEQGWTEGKAGVVWGRWLKLETAGWK